MIQLSIVKQVYLCSYLRTKLITTSYIIFIKAIYLLKSQGKKLNEFSCLVPTCLCLSLSLVHYFPLFSSSYFSLPPPISFPLLPPPSFTFLSLSLLPLIDKKKSLSLSLLKKNKDGKSLCTLLFNSLCLSSSCQILLFCNISLSPTPL